MHITYICIIIKFDGFQQNGYYVYRNEVSLTLAKTLKIIRCMTKIKYDGNDTYML